MSRKIFLVHPPTEMSRGLGASLAGNEHLGLAYVRAFLEKQGYDVGIFNIEGNIVTPKEAAERIRAEQPLWVGLSPTSLSMSWAIQFSRSVKQISDTPITFGGHLATLMGEEFMEHVPSADYVVRGDGEATSLSLTRYLEEKNANNPEIPGLIYRKNGGKLICCGEPELLSSLDDLPWPCRTLPLDPRETQSARILASRGCSYRCGFCTTPAFYKYVRYRSMDDVVDEMYFLNERFNVTRYYINDDIFFDSSKHNLARVRSFCRMVQQRLPNVRFRPLVRADVLGVCPSN